MDSVKVDLQERSYEIVVGSRILKDLGQRLKALDAGNCAVVVSNPVVVENYGDTLKKSLAQEGLAVKFIAVPAGEKSKSAKKFFEVMNEIASFDIQKKIFIIALGGGVVGDLAGFVAAVYKRGVPLVQVPTTLLAQVDSAIGGKVAIDLPQGKNLAGAFYQPRLVWSDVALLSSLDRRQVRNGLAEAVKYGAIGDKSLFMAIENGVEKLLALDPKTVEELVVTCSRIKARVVMNDERETKGMRTVLNFGHTTGHAIEAAGGFKGYHHGEAVALGMRVACEISCRLGLLKSAEALRIGDVLTRLGLPEKIKGVRLEDVLANMEHDKKFGARNKFVLLTAIGNVCVREGIAPAVVREALTAFMQ